MKHSIFKRIAASLTALLLLFSAVIPDAIAGAIPPYNYHYGILVADAVPSSVTGTTASTTLKSYTLPANALGMNGQLRITVEWSWTNSSNTKNTSLTFGGSTIFTTGQTTNAGARMTFIIANRNATNQQVAWPSINSFTQTGAAPIVTSVDTTGNVAINLTAQNVSASDTTTVECVTIEEILP